MRPPAVRTLLVSALAAGVLGGCGRKSGQTYAENVVAAYDRGKNLGAQGDIQTIAQGVTGYVAGEGHLPEAEGVAALAELLEPAYTRHVPVKDPWGEEYDYWTEADSYSISSAGQDGEWDTADDLEWRDGAMTRMPKPRVGPE